MTGGLLPGPPQPFPVANRPGVGDTGVCARSAWIRRRAPVLLTASAVTRYTGLEGVGIREQLAAVSGFSETPSQHTRIAPRAHGAGGAVPSTQYGVLLLAFSVIRAHFQFS